MTNQWFKEFDTSHTLALHKFMSKVSSIDSRLDYLYDTAQSTAIWILYQNIAQRKLAHLSIIQDSIQVLALSWWTHLLQRVYSLFSHDKERDACMPMHIIQEI